MGLFGLIGKQFIDVIEWTEPGTGILSFQYPMQDREIQNGASLTVRDSQLALFVNEGQIADLFQPGRYTLNTKTLPVLTSLNNWDKLFQSPFKSDVFFFSTREQIDQRWGTQTPVTVRDAELGPIRMRAHGTYSYRIEDPRVFFKKVSGTTQQYTAEQVEGQLRAIVLTSIASHFGEATVRFLDMAANQLKFSESLAQSLVPAFESYGLKLQSFLVQSLSLPEELQAYLDKMASMKMVGDLRTYAQFQSADSISTAAKNEGGLAGAGAGMGAGIAIGQTMASALGSLGGVAGGGPVGSGDADPIATINRLHELLTKGVITQAEFDSKKAELLKKIT